MLFNAIPVGGSLRPQEGETVEVGFFASDDLPQHLFWWHRQRIDDDLQGRQGVTWSQEVVWPLEEVDRQELYRLRDQGKLPSKELMEPFFTYPQPDKEQRETGS